MSYDEAERSYPVVKGDQNGPELHAPFVSYSEGSTRTARTSFQFAWIDL